VVFDTETTGLDTSNDDIIQIAAVEIIKGEPGKSFECYFATDKDLSPTQAIHNISNEHLAQKATDKKEGLSAFLDFIGGDALLAHNAKYDYTILNSNLLRVGLDTVDQEANPLFCTLTLTRQLCKLPSYRLGDILTSLGLEGDNSHDAMDDTKATVNLALYLKDKIKDS
jgi:DNA helicase-2/ATP-dependent DNA helicase PcrA